MKSLKVETYVALSWIISLLVSYGLGWWSGVKRATGFVSNIGGYAMPVLLIAILLASVISAFVALRLAGLFRHGEGRRDVLA